MDHRRNGAFARPGIMAIAALVLSGCALLPNTVSPVVEHTSHLSQHFGTDRTSYGYNQVALVAHWQVYRGAFIEASEGYNWGPRNTNGQACAGLYGPREVFVARAGWTFQVRP